MSTTTVIWFGILAIVGQGVGNLALLYLVRTFGVYTSIVQRTYDANERSTDEVRRVQQINAMIQVENIALADRLAALERRQPLQSEEVAS
jgi:hypothetical protein